MLVDDQKMKMAPTFVNRALAKRLTFGGLLISIVLGSLTFYFDSERVDDLFVELALHEAQQLIHDVPEMLSPLEPANHPAIERALTDLVMRPPNNDPGDYLIAEVYDTNFTLLAESAEPNIGDIESVIDMTPHPFPVSSSVEYQKYLIGGRMFLLVITPLQRPDGKVVAYLEGVYRVAPATIHNLRNSTIRTSIMVVMAVLATAFLLYPIIRRLNGRVLRHRQELLDANLGTLRALGSAVAKRDSDTSDHNYRVTLMSIRLGEAAGLNPTEMRSLIKGAFIHDVGKIAIRDSILLKPGRLDPDEFTEMKTHVSHGGDIVRHTEWLGDAAEVVRFHHEKFDGSGYLEGRSGNDIPVIARIFAIADVFDALTSTRPYKKPLSLERSLEIMESERGTHFDPHLLDVFMAIVKDLYATCAGRDEVSLEKELLAASDPYFNEMMTGA